MIVIFFNVGKYFTKNKRLLKKQPFILYLPRTIYFLKRRL